MTALAILCGIAAVLLACYPITKLALKHVEESATTEEPEVGASLPTISVPKMLYPDRERLFTASNGVELYASGAFIDAKVKEKWYRSEKSDLPEFSCSWFCYPGGEPSEYDEGERCTVAYLQWTKRQRWAAKGKA